jgi:hypothetical protein
LLFLLKAGPFYFSGLKNWAFSGPTSAYEELGGILFWVPALISLALLFDFEEWTSWPSGHINSNSKWYPSETCGNEGKKE